VGGSIDLLRTFGFSLFKNFEIKEPLVPGFSEIFQNFRASGSASSINFSEAKQPSVLGS
jgi:hypothetical protein